MPIRSLTFSPDSQLLITASDDNHIKMYDVHHSTFPPFIPLPPVMNHILCSYLITVTVEVTFVLLG